MAGSSLRPTLDWAREGRDWPHRDASRFVDAAGLRWHVQELGTGPVALLIHGTGSATHSWRGLLPLLARAHRVVAMDLPGHGYTDTPASASQFSLPGMAGALAELVDTLGLDVALTIGHSAGAAIGARLVLDGRIEPRALVAINGAFMPLAGVAGVLFPPVARLMAATPLAAQLFARRSRDPAAVERLIRGTGSTLDAAGRALYGRLVQDARHASGALAMMAGWDLRPLAGDLARFTTPLALIVGSNDRAVPPRDAERVQALLPTSTPSARESVLGAGHLVHEERPAEVVERMRSALLRILPD